MCPQLQAIPNDWRSGTFAASQLHRTTVPHPVSARGDAALVRLYDALNTSGLAFGLANPLQS